jgi:hypothetical protein
MGPKSVGIFHFNIASMASGDRAGAAMFRDNMAYIGVQKSGSTAQIIMVNNLVISGSGWPTTGHGSTAATGPTLSSTQTDVWFQISADITPAFSGTSAVRQTTFSYSLDGCTWTNLGPSFGLSNSYTYFTGYRYAAFNYATSSLGGSVLLKSFTHARSTPSGCVASPPPPPPASSSTVASPPPPASSSTVAIPPPPASSSTVVTSPSPSSTAGCASLYGQCGGIGWAGATCCSQGTCKVGNPYYSQCLS